MPLIARLRDPSVTSISIQEQILVPSDGRVIMPDHLVAFAQRHLRHMFHVPFDQLPAESVQITTTDDGSGDPKPIPDADPPEDPENLGSGGPGEGDEDTDDSDSLV